MSRCIVVFAYSIYWPRHVIINMKNKKVKREFHITHSATICITKIEELAICKGHKNCNSRESYSLNSFLVNITSIDSKYTYHIKTIIYDINFIWCGSIRTTGSDANTKWYCGTIINVNFNSYDSYQNEIMLVCLSNKRGIGVIYIKRIRAITSSAVCLWVDIFIFRNVCHPICEK